MRSVEEHQRAVADLIRPRPPVTVALADAEGLVLAADVIAPISLPVFDNSGMDGYAVLADDIAMATPETPVRLPVTEDIPAGRTDIPTLTPGTAHRIMTGAPIPYGADGVIPVEATDGGTDAVQISAATDRGRHIRRAGGDVAEGATVLWAGQL
ncbi:MAG: molybdopterin molybdenumtransferase MoeA, partial [Mycobacterium sp.]